MDSFLFRFLLVFERYCLTNLVCGTTSVSLLRWFNTSVVGLLNIKDRVFHLVILHLTLRCDIPIKTFCVLNIYFSYLIVITILQWMLRISASVFLLSIFLSIRFFVLGIDQFLIHHLVKFILSLRHFINRIIETVI